MANYSNKNINYVRQVLSNRLGRPAPALALYALNSDDTSLQVQLADAATQINIRYVAATTTTETVTFTGKSLKQLVLEINQLGLPVRAVALAEIENMVAGDLINIDTAYLEIPSQFPVYDRLRDNGIVLRSKKISVRHKGTSKITLLQPYLENPGLPWYPRIQNGSFTQVYNDKVYHYYLSEFDNQTWSPVFGKPFVTIQGVNPIFIERGVYRLPRTPVFWNGENVVLYNGDVPISAAVVEDIDTVNGYLYLKDSFTPPPNFTLDYTYVENSYVYKDININAHFSQNPLLLEKFVIIYMVPIEGSSGPNKKTVYHVVGDSIDDAISSITVSDPSIPIAILGAYNIQQIYVSNRINLLDTRVKGGGLVNVPGPVSPVHHIESPIATDKEPIENTYVEATRFWDIGNYDGEAYPGAAAVVIDLPLNLRDNLAIDDISNKSSKFLAAGIYPLVDFTERELPQVSGGTYQVSCFVNTDLETVYEANGGVLELDTTIPQNFSGAGWSKSQLDLPSSLLTGNLSINYDIPVHDTVDSTHIRIERTGVFQSYLKGSSIAGVSWEERTIIENENNRAFPLIYSDWKKKSYLDYREVTSGQLLKGYLDFPDTNITREVKNVKVHSPYIPIQDFTQQLESNIIQIIDKIVDLQPTGSLLASGTDIAYQYGNVLDPTVKSDYSDYLLLPEVYQALYNFANTPIEDHYADLLYGVGQDAIKAGIRTGGHWFNFYIQSIHKYTGNDGIDYTGLEYNVPLTLLNKYITYRARKNQWSSDCDAALLTSTGLVVSMFANTGTYGALDPGIPLLWTFNNKVGLSGHYIPAQGDLGGSYAEILEAYNLDVYYNTSLPAIFSAAMAHTGAISTLVAQKLVDSLDLTVRNTIDNIDLSLSDERTMSGLPVVNTHWYTTFGRHGKFLGTTLKNLIEAYEYAYKYLSSQDITDITAPAGINPTTLNHLFSGIETCLEAGYDGVSNNLLRGGVVEPEMAYTIYGYGWYVNNWYDHHGLVGKTYTSKYTDKYKQLFDDGLKCLTKSHFTNYGTMYETKFVNHEPGPFTLAVPAKILYPLSEAIEYDEWKGVVQGMVTTINNSFNMSGLYYTDPRKHSTAPGREYDILDGISKIYTKLTSTGDAISLWEPVDSELSQIRGANYLSVYQSYDVSAPVAGWKGVQNATTMWRHYSSGDITKEIHQLLDYGINTIKVPLSYPYWLVSGEEYYERFDHFMEICRSGNLRVIPSFLQGRGNEILDVPGHVHAYGHTGGWTKFTPGDELWFTGSQSGRNYLSGFITRYDNDPSIIAWEVSDWIETGIPMLYNNIAHYIKSLTDTPLILSLGDTITNTDIITVAQEGDYISYELGDPFEFFPLTTNPNFDFIGLQSNAMFSKLIDIQSGVIPRNIILTNLGTSTFGDYELTIDDAIDRELPFILSNIYIPSTGIGTDLGKEEGILYADNATRSDRQLRAIGDAAKEHDVEVDPDIYQILRFDGRIFYESGYRPAYTREYVYNELAQWSNRFVNPLEASNTGEFRRQRHILMAVQSGLDTINPTSRINYAYNLGLLSLQEQQLLNYYRINWNSGDFIASSATSWTTGSVLDTSRYATFFTNWGTDLYNIIARLNLNG